MKSTLTDKEAEQFVLRIEHTYSIVRDHLKPEDRDEAIERLTGKSDFAGQTCCEPGQVRKQLFSWAREERRMNYLEACTTRENG